MSSNRMKEVLIFHGDIMQLNIIKQVKIIKERMWPGEVWLIAR